MYPQLTKKFALLAIATLLTTMTINQTALAEPRADVQMRAVLDELEKLGGKPIETLSAEEARQQPTLADAVKSLVTKKEGKPPTPEAVASVVDQTIAGPGGAIPIRIYTPDGTGPFPVIVYYHGGGWVIGDLDTYDATPRALANAANAVVVSAHYRQAPEHKFPAAHEDALAAYKWTLAHAKEFNGDSNRVALVGESAGGNLAAAVSVMARDQKLPMPVHQVLVYPITDYNFLSHSYKGILIARPLNQNVMKWFFEQYLNSPTEGENRLISLKNEDNLKGLPSTTVITAQIDPLRTEGREYYDKLRQAGIKVRHRNYDGVTHEFFGMGAAIEKAKWAQKYAADGLKAAFAGEK